MLRFQSAGGVVVAAFMIGASAAPAPAFAAPADSSWTGFYLGGNFGGGWGHDAESSVSTNTIGTLRSSSTADPSGLLGGGQFGFNYELPSHLLLELEADADWADITGSTPTSCSTYSSVNTGLDSFLGTIGGCGHNHLTLDAFGTLRARLGIVWDNVLLYGTGGLALGKASNTNTTTCITNGDPGTYPCNPGSGYPFTGGVSSYSDMLTGWTAGAGVEWGIRRNWTFRVEYLHLGFGDVTTNFQTTLTPSGGPSFTTPASVTSNMNADIVRVGLNYVFN